MFLDSRKETIIDSIELPKIVKLSENLYGAAFSLMKLLPARFIIDNAIKEGLINKDSVIIESSSGTFALGLATVCSLYGYNLIVVSDPAMDDNLKRRIEDLGAQVEIMDEPGKAGNFQRARLDRVKELQKQYPNHYWTNQYDNPLNAKSYSLVAQLLVEKLGKIDFLVGSVGSGGSMCGTTMYIRKLFPELYSVAVDTHGSVIFGENERKRILRGLGNSIIPDNVNHSIFDEVHWVEASQAYALTRKLHREHALYMGGTSGASYLVADWYAKKNPNAKGVVLFPDQGYRYQSTIYNDDWLHSNNLFLSELPSEPRLVQYPEEAEYDWCRIIWGRRMLEDIKLRETLGK